MPTTVSPDGPRFGPPDVSRSDQVDQIHKDAPRAKSVTALVLSFIGFLFLIWVLFLATNYWHGIAGRMSVPYDQVIASASVAVVLFVAAIGIQIEQLAARREYIARELAKLR